MKKRILITGVSGFIGRKVAEKFLNTDYNLIGLIRPGTQESRIKDLRKCFNFYEVDLSDLEELENFMRKNTFDIIIHVGALRGGRDYSREVFHKANIDATRVIIRNAYDNNTKLVFCSSVGVFGAIPQSLPAGESTPRQDDNYYHFTKNVSESHIKEFVAKGLNAVIIRPSITYGKGDYGFPFTLTKLVDKNIFFLPDNEVKIHLTNVDLLAQAFYNAANLNLKSGNAYIVADKQPVRLDDLIIYIAQQLGKSNYRRRIISKTFFEYGEKLAKMLKNETWTARFQLISRSWYYQVDDSYRDLHLEPSVTIPSFSVVTDWYKELKNLKKQSNLEK